MKKIAQNLWENGAKYASKLCAHFMVVAYIFSLDFVYKKINNKIKINNEAEVVCVAVIGGTADYCLDEFVLDEFVKYFKVSNSSVVKWIFLAPVTALVLDEITAIP